MNKFLKCWVFIICLLFIFLILFTDRVNAETCEPVYYENLYSELNKIETLNLGKNSFSYNFYNNNTIQFTNAEYIKGQMWYAIQKTNGTYTSNINYDLTCSTSIQGDHGETAIITYADGTQASISYNEYIAICTQWTQNNANEVGTFEYDPKITSIGLNIGLSGSAYKCEVDLNGNYKCPVNKNWNYTRMQFELVLSNSQSTNVRFGITSQIIYKCNSDTTQIINNQNQNFQQQHQDNQAIIQEQQNINNSITSDNVTGNNSNSSITTIGNTFNTQGDFLLNLLTIPYNLWTSILNVLGDSCDPIDVGTIFGEHLVFPCINLNSLLGGVWTTIIDVIFTGMIYSAFIRRVIKYFRELLTLDPQALETGGVKIW